MFITDFEIVAVNLEEYNKDGEWWVTKNFELGDMEGLHDTDG